MNFKKVDFKSPEYQAYFAECEMVNKNIKQGLADSIEVVKGDFRNKLIQDNKDLAYKTVNASIISDIQLLATENRFSNTLVKEQIENDLESLSINHAKDVRKAFFTNSMKNKIVKNLCEASADGKVTVMMNDSYTRMTAEEIRVHNNMHKDNIKERIEYDHILSFSWFLQEENFDTLKNIYISENGDMYSTLKKIAQSPDNTLMAINTVNQPKSDHLASECEKLSEWTRNEYKNKWEKQSKQGLTENRWENFIEGGLQALADTLSDGMKVFLIGSAFNVVTDIVIEVIADAVDNNIDFSNLVDYITDNKKFVTVVNNEANKLRKVFGNISDRFTAKGIMEIVVIVLTTMFTSIIGLRGFTSKISLMNHIFNVAYHAGYKGAIGRELSLNHNNDKLLKAEFVATLMDTTKISIQSWLKCNTEGCEFANLAYIPLIRLVSVSTIFYLGYSQDVNDKYQVVDQARKDHILNNL